jgi:hypothetical protein
MVTRLDQTNPDFVDLMIYYHTHLNTYFHWIHHGVPVGMEDQVMKSHPIGFAFEAGLRRAGVHLSDKRPEETA